MADLRIYELADTQASYSSAIYLQVDDPGFSNTKKIAIGTIYPKTNTLGVAGDFNPATSLVRLDNGSGAESKVTVDNLLTDADVIVTLKTNLGLDISSVSFSGTKDSNISSFTVNGNENGNLIVISGTFVAINSNIGSPQFLQQIDGYTSPGFQVLFCINPTTSALEQGNGYVDTDGKIYVVAGKGSSQTWVFSVTILSA